MIECTPVENQLPHSLLDPVLLRSFVAVAGTGSFTRAAQSVHLTQSTVSQQVRRLEEQLGCVLLDRSGRHVLPTPEGERLLGYAQRITQLMAEAVEQLAASAGQSAIRLGVPEDFAARALTPTFAAFADAHPQVRLEDGLGLTLLPRRLATAGHRLLGAAEGLAPVPDLELALHARPDLSAPAKALAGLLVQVCRSVVQA